MFLCIIFDVKFLLTRYNKTCTTFVLKTYFFIELNIHYLTRVLGLMHYAPSFTQIQVYFGAK